MELTREQIERIKKYGLHAIGCDERIAATIALCDFALRGLDCAPSATETTQDPVALSEAAILKALYASGLGVRPFIYESCKDGICIDRTTVQVDNFVKAIIKLVAPACTVPEERLIGWVQELSTGKKCFHEGDLDPRTVHDNGRPCYPVYAKRLDMNGGTHE